MKKALFVFVILISVLMSSQAQEKLKIGEVKAGKLVITNQDALKAFVMNRLEKSGTLGKDYQVSSSPEGDRFLVYFTVSGNKANVNCIGVMLVKINSDAIIVSNPPETIPGGGGSVEFTCTGVDCSQCVPNIRWVGNNWIPEVYCDCRSGGGGKCNMSIKITLKVDI